MNVAVKTLNQSTLIDQREPLVILGGKQLAMLALSIIILASAFSVVFVRDINRQLMNQLQVLENTQSNLHNEWSQLLLEQSTWASQARIQQIATQDLSMVVPKTRSTIIIDQ